MGLAWAAYGAFGSWTTLPELRTVTLERRDLSIMVAASGTVEPETVVEVGALAAGRIQHFGPDADAPDKEVDVGSRVTKGDVLIQLDAELHELAVQKAQAALRLAQAEVGRLEAQLQNAQRELARAQQLRDTNSPSDYDKVQTTHQMAAAELAIGRARVDQALAEARQADINLARATIRSPIDGVVIDRRANLGQNVGPGAPGLLLIAKSVDRLR
ncbi:MAG: biotin/lipoyl-binding protein, partial [Planctomycetales bacterium]|nr:biotin/lipoyl-binding protein [Planctomycetales bacterium]